MTPTWPVLKKGTQFTRAFWNDTSGVILPYVTIMLLVIVGLSVLALDGARLMSLQTQLQNGADALALAGAAELDRLPDAETRARTAIERLLTNSTLFGSRASRTIAVSNIKFYSHLPASDASPMSVGKLATGRGMRALSRSRCDRSPSRHSFQQRSSAGRTRSLPPLRRSPALIRWSVGSRRSTSATLMRPRA